MNLAPMDLMRVMLLLAMVALPVGLFVWARRRRASRMDPAAARAGFDAVMAGAPLTDDLIKAVAVHTALNSYSTHGVVEHAVSKDVYAVRLADATLVRGVRSHRLWRRSVVLAPGERVALLAVVGGSGATILRRL